MFSRIEQNDTKKLIVAKLLAFKQILAVRSSSNDLYHHFLLDVLKDVLDEASKATRLVFPLDDKQKTVFDYHLYQQYDLFYLQDSDALSPQTIKNLFSRYDRTVPNSTGIVLYRDVLQKIQFDENRNVTAMEQIDSMLTPAAYAELSASIIDKTQSRHHHKETHIIADEAQRALVARLLNIPNVKQPRSDEFMVVINLIEEIENQLKTNLNIYQRCRRQALDLALGFTIMVGGGLLLQNSVALLLSYVMGKTITIATITMLTYIFAATLGLILTVALGMALYLYINERQYSRQLTALRSLVNQSKAYELDDNTTVPVPDSFNYAKPTWGGDTLERTFFRNETNPKIGHFEIKFPSVSALFFHHKSKLQEMTTKFQPTLM